MSNDMEEGKVRSLILQVVNTGREASRLSTIQVCCRSNNEPSWQSEGVSGRGLTRQQRRVFEGGG
jgi:hypothetical protein